MTLARRISAAFTAFLCVLAFAVRSGAEPIQRAAIAAHQDEMQNLVIECQEIRKYDVDAATIDQNFRAEHTQFDLVRSETANLTFSFLNGNARYDRRSDEATLKYWAAKKLPAIISQTLSVSASGRVEELTTQQLTNGKKPSFGGFRQLDQFSPEDTIDIALGLRLLGDRRWLTKEDLNAMQEVQQPDSSIVDLIAQDAGGHTHELRFDRRFLFALVYYRCSNAHGASVEITNTDFRTYGNVFIPGKITRVSNIPRAGGQISHPLIFTYVVKTAAVNDVRNTASRYVIRFPSHLLLFDARTNDEVEVGPIARSFTDDDIHRQIVERQLRQEMYEGLAKRRIEQALSSQPATQP
jgi:hypothetical protein